MTPEMSPNKPYLIRALHEWILDNGLTPHVIVDVHAENVAVPASAVQDGKLVLNIAPQATKALEISNSSITFEARFSGTPHNIYLPIESVLAIYARENGQGMMFARDNETDAEKPSSDKSQDSSNGGAPHLKLIK